MYIYTMYIVHCSCGNNKAVSCMEEIQTTLKTSVNAVKGDADTYILDNAMYSTSSSTQRWKQKTKQVSVHTYVCIY